MSVFFIQRQSLGSIWSAVDYGSIDFRDEQTSAQSWPHDPERLFRVAPESVYGEDLPMHFGDGRTGFRRARKNGLGKIANIGRAATLLGITALAGRVAHALEPSDVLSYSIGPVSLRPQAMAFTEFNDNIFYRKTNVESDVIIGISPGLRALVGTDLPNENHIAASYRFEQDFYLDHSELDAMQHRFALDSFYGTERTEIEGRDRIEFLASTLGGGFSSVTGLKVKRTVWEDVYSVNYRFGERTAAFIRAEHGLTDYERGITLFDLRSLEGALGFEWLLSQRTRIFGEGYFGRIFVDSNTGATDPPSSNYGGGFIGARGQFTEKLVGFAKAGYEFYQFDDTTAVTGGTDSGNTPVFETALTFALTERTTLDLNYRRRQQVSPEFTRSAYVADEVVFRAAARLGSADRLRVDVAGNLGFYSFDPSPAYAERNDTIWGVTAGVSWQFESWLSSRLEYSFRQLRSDLPTILDYHQNRITASISIGY